MSRHARTPGAWHIVELDGGASYTIQSDDLDADPVVWEMGGIDNEADARLIAAAPDLLAACERAYDALNELLGAEYDVAGDLELLRAAIRTARGD